MKNIEIGGKEYEVTANYGHFRKLIKKHDIFAMESWTMGEYDQYVFDAIWMFLRRRWYGLKPFAFKWRLMNEITIPELRNLRAKVNTLLLGPPVTQAKTEPAGEAKGEPGGK